MACGVILSVLATLNSQQMIDSYRLVVVQNQKSYPFISMLRYTKTVVLDCTLNGSFTRV